MKKKLYVMADEEEAEASESGPQNFAPEDFFNFSEAHSEKNRIYFYSDIDKTSILNLNVTLQQVTNKLMSRAFELSQEPANIFLHLNSSGGSVFDGLIASDYVRKNKVPVYTIVDGSCASAATFISIVGKRRFIHENSFMLIHQLSSEAWGTFADLEDELTNCKTLMTTIKNLYKQHTKIPAKQLDEILKRDLWFTAKEAVKYGLVDSII
jgi:ATP-dependent Clp endopeptidase proteolytic subunit ClpP